MRVDRQLIAAYRAILKMIKAVRTQPLQSR